METFLLHASGVPQIINGAYYIPICEGIPVRVAEWNGGSN